MMRLSTLILFVVILSIDKIDPLLVVFPLFFLAFGGYVYSQRCNINFHRLSKINSGIFLLSLLLLISILRSHANSSVSNYYYSLCLLLFTWAYATAVFYNFGQLKKSWTKITVSCVLMPVFLLCVLNWVLLWAGIKFVNQYADSGNRKAVFLSLLGIDANRTVFPLTDGINAYSNYIGGAFSIAIILFLFSKQYKSVTGGISCIFLLTLLYTDSRAALIYPILIAGIIFFFRNKILGGWIKFLSLIVFIGPLIYTIMLPWLSHLSEFQSLSRGSGDLSSGNDRLFIWSICYKEFLSFKWNHLFGFGKAGHYISGVSATWAANSSTYNNAELALSPHNTMFSILFDYGYVGLITYIVLLWQTLSKISFISKKSKIAYPFFGFLIYNIFLGITESIGSAFQFNYIVLFIAVITVINAQFYVLKWRLKNKNYDERKILSTIRLTS